MEKIIFSQSQGFSFDISTSSRRENAKEANFTRTRITNLFDLENHLSKDHCCSLFVNGYRKRENFFRSEIAFLDYDSGKTLEEVINLLDKDIKEKIPDLQDDIAFFAKPSRNHLKEKNGIVSPRFHLYFFLDPILTEKDIPEFEAFINTLINLSGADKAAKDVARLIFGSETKFENGRSLYYRNGIKFPWKKYLENYQDYIKQQIKKIEPIDNIETQNSEKYYLSEENKNKIRKVLPNLKSYKNGNLPCDKYENWIDAGIILKRYGFTFDDFLKITYEENLSDAENKWKSFHIDEPKYGKPLSINTLISFIRDVYPDFRLSDESKNNTNNNPQKKKLIRFLELNGRQKMKWLISHFIPENSVGLIYGQSGIGKSFWVLDLAMRLAENKPYYDYNTHNEQKRPVIYLAGEGFADLYNRYKAWTTKYNNGKDVENIFLNDGFFNFSSKDDENALIECLEEVEKECGLPPVMLIIDTLHRHWDGDENSSQDAKQMLSICDRIKNRFGCTILLVHHTGANPEAQGRARGSSAWRSDVDVEFSIVGDKKEKSLTVKQTKNKYDKEADPIYYWLETVLVEEQNEQGDEVTSCILVKREGETLEQYEKKKENKKEQKEIEKLYKVIDKIVESANSPEELLEITKRKFREALKEVNKEYAQFDLGINEEDLEKKAENLTKNDLREGRWLMKMSEKGLLKIETINGETRICLLDKAKDYINSVALKEFS